MRTGTEEKVLFAYRHRRNTETKYRSKKSCSTQAPKKKSYLRIGIERTEKVLLFVGTEPKKSCYLQAPKLNKSCRLQAPNPKNESCPTKTQAQTKTTNKSRTIRNDIARSNLTHRSKVQVQSALLETGLCVTTDPRRPIPIEQSTSSVSVPQGPPPRLVPTQIFAFRATVHLRPTVQIE